MSLETSRKVLKIVGILIIISAVISLIGGIAFLGIGNWAAGDAEILAEEGAVEGIGGTILLGGLLLVSGIFSLIEGIISVKASKNNKFGTAAFIFAILGLLSSIGSAINSISNDASASNIGSSVLTIVLSVLILLAANKIRLARKAEQ